MTREEAIHFATCLKNNWTINFDDMEEFCDMAIKTLNSIMDSDDDMFCKSQLITCNRVKECNGVCPFEDALQHADKMQAMNEQHIVNHDREWIIGCIEHDGFIHTHRFDKANQIIHDALSADAVEVVRCKDCKYHHYSVDNIPYCDWQNNGYGWNDDDFCSWGERKGGDTE